MIEDYYICLDATALYFAHKYLKVPVFTTR